MKTVDLPPYAPTLMESTRAIGYSIEAAIADIIDNSIAASASRVDIDFFPIGESYIAILDNGWGMSSESLIAAMQYGSRNPLEIRDENDLGRYGLGMKTASLSQCRILTVLSKKSGVLTGAQWNLNHIQRAESWSLLLVDEEEAKKYPSFDKLNQYENGTLVVWQDLDKFAVGETDIAEAFAKKMELIREHLSLVFHRYLSGETGLKKLDIRMNEQSVEPQDPFLLKKSTQLMDEEVIVVRGQKVRVKPYILPHTSKLTQKELKSLGGKDGLRKNQGFYVYRNKRLLVWGNWFRLMRQGDLSKLARVQVDIPNSLDDLWTLDIKKSTAAPPEEVKRNLSVIIQKISEGSKRTWTYRGKKETNDNIIHMWNRLITRDGSILYEVNPDHPLVESIVSAHPELQTQLEALLKQIGMSLPINSLYIDLTNDEKMDNDNDNKGAEVIMLLKNVISTYSGENKESFNHTKAFIWRNVPKKAVIEIVRNYITHPWNLNFQPAALAEYIAADESSLDFWDVAIPQDSDTSQTVEIDLIDGTTVDIHPKGRPLEWDSTSKNMLKVYGRHVRIGSGGCTKIGLSEQKIKDLREEFGSSKDSTYLHTERNPLLLIHILTNTNPEKKQTDPKQVFALGLRLPSEFDTVLVLNAA